MIESPGASVWISLAMAQFALAAVLRYLAGRAGAGVALAAAAGVLLAGAILRFGSQAGLNAPSLQLYMTLFVLSPGALYGLRCSIAGVRISPSAAAARGRSAIAWAGLGYGALIVVSQALAPPAARFYLPWALLLAWFAALAGLGPQALAARLAAASLFFQPFVLLQIARAGGRADFSASPWTQDAAFSALLLAALLALWLELRAVRAVWSSLLIATPAALCALMSSLAAGRPGPALAGLVGAALAALVGEFFDRSRREARIDSSD